MQILPTQFSVVQMKVRSKEYGGSYIIIWRHQEVNYNSTIFKYQPTVAEVGAVILQMMYGVNDDAIIINSMQFWFSI